MLKISYRVSFKPGLLRYARNDGVKFAPSSRTGIY